MEYRQSSQYISHSVKTEVTYQEVPAHKEFQFVLQFSKHITSEQLDQVERLLKQNGLLTLRTQTLHLDRILLFIALHNPHIILHQAEKMYFYKFCKQKDLNQRHQIDKKLELALNKVNPKILHYEELRRFTLRTRDNFIDDPQTLKLSGSLTSIDQFKHNDLKPYLQIFSKAEILKIIYNYIWTLKISDLDMIHYIRQKGYLKNITPLHCDEPIDYSTTDGIEKYFGQNISVYFEFINFFQKYLAIPSVASVFLFCVEYFFNEQFIIHKGYKLSIFSFLYSSFIMVWSTFFLLKWKRKESELCIKWGIFSSNQKAKALDTNIYFKGENTLKLTTGHFEEDYPSKKRVFLYFISAIEALPFLLIAAIIKLVIFNINGFIKHPQSIMYIPMIAAINQPGGLLHPFPFISTILDYLTIITIYKMNLAYTRQSVISTIRENHKTTIGFNNSVIVKRFIFELINRFFHLWYIAFIEFDLITLKSLLTKLFVMDAFRRVLLESLLPLVMKKNFEREKTKYREELKKKTDLSDDIVERVVELNLWEYDDFDDYIEVIFQFGYIILFAAIFPLAAPISLVFNLVEVWSDRFKLGKKLYQRNLPTKVTGIGQWNTVLTSLTVISIYSNISFLGFSYFNLFESCNLSLYQQQATNTDNCQLERFLVILFVFEHIILGIKYILYRKLNKKPYWVRVLIRRLKLKNIIH